MIFLQPGGDQASGKEINALYHASPLQFSF